MKNWYAILGVQQIATLEEIKKKYRELAKRFHPDVSKEDNADDKFKEIQVAYETLSDKDKRNKYDFLLQEESNTVHNHKSEHSSIWGTAILVIVIGAIMAIIAAILFLDKKRPGIA